MGIREIERSLGITYGVLKLSVVIQAALVEELRDDGIRVGKNRVWQLMKQHGLRVKTAKRFRVTTNSEHK